MYTLTNSGAIMRDDGAFIPNDPDNVDYRKYLAWISEGNTPASMPEPVGPTDSQKAQQELDTLERTTLMSRGMREYLLVSMQDLAQRQSDQMADQGITMSALDILKSQPAWAKLVQINSQATELRKRITE